jgi:serine/threonine protein kinase
MKNRPSFTLQSKLSDLFSPPPPSHDDQQRRILSSNLNTSPQSINSIPSSKKSLLPLIMTPIEKDEMINNYNGRCVFPKTKVLSNDDNTLMQNAEKFRFKKKTDIKNGYIFFNDEYTIVCTDEQIGKGSFGIVYLGEMTNNKTQEKKTIVIKKLFNSDTDVAENNHLSFCNETNIMAQIEHKNIAKYYGFYNDYNIEFVLFYEFISNINLKKMIDNKTLSFNQKIKIMIQLMDGLLYLHNNNVYHGDIKPDNIMIYFFNDEIIPVYIDFGLSCKGGSLCNKEPTYTTSYASIQLKNYRSDTERNLENKQFLKLMKMNDIWTLGISLLKLFTNYELKISEFTEETVILTYHKKKLQELRNLNYPRDITGCISLMIGSMLQYDLKDSFAQYRTLLLNNYTRDMLENNELISLIDEVEKVK